MICSGIKEIDEILDDNTKNGLIIDIFGAAGTGKTQLTLQFIVNALLKDQLVLLQDTTGNFRPERLREILIRNDESENLLNNIHVNRILNTSDQIKSLSELTEKNNYSMVVIDSLTDLFSFEYHTKEQAIDKNSIFMKYMRNLSSVTQSKKISVIVTNMVRTIDNIEVENLEKLVDLYSHIKIKLVKKEKSFTGLLTSLRTRSRFSYIISQDGLKSS